MPRPALQPDDVAAFRKRAVDAAMHLFAEEGYGAVTMRGLGAALGVSAMTPYRYLANKDELFAMCRAEAFRRFGDALEAALAGTKDPITLRTADAVLRAPAEPELAIAKLGRLKQAYLAFALEQPDAYRIMFEVRKPDTRELSTEARRAFGFLHATVEAAVEAGKLRGDALTLAHLFWANTHGLVSLHLAGRLGGRSLKELASIDHELAAFRRKP